MKLEDPGLFSFKNSSFRDILKETFRGWLGIRWGRLLEDFGGEIAGLPVH